MLHPDRYFSPIPEVRAIARALYQRVANLPLVCPHGHVDPRILAEDTPFPDPAALIVIPDHYITRMLYSQGVPLEALGVPRRDGGPVERDPRAIWRTFASRAYLFAGTPSGAWLSDELERVFGVDEPLTAASADRIYDAIESRLSTPEFRPRRLFERFNIDVLCTTDAASDPLEWHQRLRISDWGGDVRPTFRPDRAIDILHAGWADEIARISELSKIDISTYERYVRALENRRAHFKSLGATATDHAVEVPWTASLSQEEAASIFDRALQKTASAADARAFTAHMLMEMARMSVDDGLVMQLHPGSARNHNQDVFERFGPDQGADIPLPTEYTRNLSALLNRFGNERAFTLVLFTLDETTYSRELAPLAGHYPAVRLGPPWWFHDSIEGMLRFRQQVTETAGFYNTAGFNDDTRAFLSIPARHDLARRVDAQFLADLVSRHVLRVDEAERVIGELAVGLARKTYKLDPRATE